MTGSFYSFRVAVFLPVLARTSLAVPPAPPSQRSRSHLRRGRPHLRRAPPALPCRAPTGPSGAPRLHGHPASWPPAWPRTERLWWWGASERKHQQIEQLEVPIRRIEVQSEPCYHAVKRPMPPARAPAYPATAATLACPGKVACPPAAAATPTAPCVGACLPGTHGRARLPWRGHVPSGHRARAHLPGEVACQPSRLGR
jgi:hypothetical protein